MNPVLNGLTKRAAPQARRQKAFQRDRDDGRPQTPAWELFAILCKPAFEQHSTHRGRNGFEPGRRRTALVRGSTVMARTRFGLHQAGRAPHRGPCREMAELAAIIDREAHPPRENFAPTPRHGGMRESFTAATPAETTSALPVHCKSANENTTGSPRTQGCMNRWIANERVACPDR